MLTEQGQVSGDWEEECQPLSLGPRGQNLVQKELLRVVVVFRCAPKFLDISLFKRWFNSLLLRYGLSGSLLMNRIQQKCVTSKIRS